MYFLCRKEHIMKKLLKVLIAVVMVAAMVAIPAT